MYSALNYIFNNNPYRKFCIEKENTKLKSIIRYNEKKYNIIIKKYIDLEDEYVKIEDEYVKIEDKYIEIEKKYIEIEKKYIQLKNKYIELEYKYEKVINISFNYNEEDIIKSEDFYNFTNNSLIYNEDGIIETGEYEPIFI